MCSSDLSSGYACGDIDARNKVLMKCAEWAQMFRDVVDEVCSSSGGTWIKKKKKKGPQKAKLMSGEFSAASHHSVRRSCNDIGNLRESYVTQVEAAQSEGVDVEMFYWSYKMPYGGAFRRAWSFQELMYNLGVVDRPDMPQFDCDSNLIDDPELPQP